MKGLNALFRFLTIMIKKGSRSLSTKVNIHFHDMVKIRIKIIQNVNIFALYGTVTSHRNFKRKFTKMKLKCLEKIKKCLVYL